MKGALSLILLSIILSLLPCSHLLYPLYILRVEHTKLRMIFKSTAPFFYLEYTSTGPSIFYVANFQPFVRTHIPFICEQSKEMFEQWL